MEEDKPDTQEDGNENAGRDDKAKQDEKAPKKGKNEEVDESAEETFPASDPPAW